MRRNTERFFAAQRVGLAAWVLAGVGLAALHLLPRPHLMATTGARILYQPTNFLSEYARTEYAPLMVAIFILLAFGTLATAVTIRSLRREAVLTGIAGIALLLLAVFPTDLADLATDAVTCGMPERIEPCTMIGRIHNPLSTFVFFPVALVAVSFCVRSRREPRWRVAAALALLCGVVAVCGIVGAGVYLQNTGWHGRRWTGLMQRSLVFPAIVWTTGLLLAAKNPAEREGEGR